MSFSTVSDSLNRIWQNEGLDDSTRSVALHELTWSFYSADQLDSMLIYAKLNYDFVIEAGLKDRENDALFGLGMASKMNGNSHQAIGYFTEALEIAKKKNDDEDIGGNLIQLGNLYSSQGSYDKAINCFEECFEIFERNNNVPGESIILKDIGEVYLEKKNYTKALEYLEKSRTFRDSLRRIDEDRIGFNESVGYAQTLADIGICHMNLNDYDKAFDHFEQSLAIYLEIDEKRGIAEGLTRLGDIYSMMENSDSAVAKYQESLAIGHQINNEQQVAHTSLRLGLFYLQRDKFNQANKWCKQSLNISEVTGFVLEQRNACECLYEANKSLHNSRASLIYLEKLLHLDDSLKSEETTLRLQEIEFQKAALADSLIQEERKREIEAKHKAEVKRKDINRNIVLAILVFILIVAAAMYNRVRFIRRAKNRIEKEKNRSDSLLLNILPLEIAQELKIKGEAEARDYTDVTILFTDFKQFTQLSETMSAKELVSELNYCFKAFDRICETYKIEKIKTIGDSFMAAGGIPVATPYSAKNTVLAAIAMNKFVKERKKDLDSQKKTAFEMRLGIHTGSVVAGIVGVKKFQYDIWGDSVNTASRMESNSVVGKINISNTTYKQIKNDPDFVFEHRGKVQAKGKGEVDMYFVSLKES